MLSIFWQQVFCSGHIVGLVQDCSISSALAMEMRQHCTKQSIRCCQMFAKYSHWFIVALRHLVLGDQQGKSEGFESCVRPIVRKRTIWVEIGDVLSRVTLKFDGWPWKTIGHLSFAVSLCIISYPLVNSNLSYSPETPNLGQIRRFLRAVRPWNLTDDLEKQ